MDRIPRKQLDESLVAEGDTATVTAVHTYTTLPQSSATPSSSSDLVTKSYVDTRLQSGCRAYLSVAQAIPDDTYTQVVFDTVSFDTLSEYDDSPITGVFTVDTAGRYLVIATVGFESNATGTRGISVTLNGTDYVVGPQVAATGSGSPADHETILTLTAIVVADAADEIAIEVYQDSGGSLDTTSGEDMAVLMVQRVY